MVVVKEYYDRRADEYDQSLFERRDPEAAAAFTREMSALGEVLAALQPARVLDVACGTGLFTRYLRGQVVAVDQSQRMLAIAGRRVPTARLVRAAAPTLPFADLSFDRLFTSFFYGHLVDVERLAFLAEARRLAPELVVADAAAYQGVQPDGWRQRVLRDGTRYTVYKRHFTAAQLLAELGGQGEVLFAQCSFVAVRAALSG